MKLAPMMCPSRATVRPRVQRATSCHRVRRWSSRSTGVSQWWWTARETSHRTWAVAHIIKMRVRQETWASWWSTAYAKVKRQPQQSKSANKAPAQITMDKEWTRKAPWCLAITIMLVKAQTTTWQQWANRQSKMWPWVVTTPSTQLSSPLRKIVS